MSTNRSGRKRRGGRVWKIFLALILFSTGGLALWASTLTIPALDSFNDRRVTESAKIYDRTGQVVLYDLSGSAKRSSVPFDRISKNIQMATVAIEDSSFYEHRGINVKSFFRALFVNTTTFGFSQGGSTITQQVVKNSLLTTEKRLSRKIKEWVLALKLERVASKNRILEIYLNETPYGGNIYGVQEASLSFFNKNASELTLAESAYLVALPQAPTRLSPYGNHREDLENRKNLVLRRMKELGFIGAEEYTRSLEERVTFLPRREKGLLAPHFVFYVKEYIESVYGERAMENQGLKIITTLDYPLQQKAEEIVKKYAVENEGRFNAENAAAIGIDPATGHILFMVGSRDYFDKTIDGNFNIALAKRQPGSAFKPFVYATAFGAGYTPETKLFDTETEFSTTCDAEGRPLSEGAACYKPKNYDNTHRGPVSLRNALAQSINIPAVKLLYLSGIDESLETARSVGINTLTDKSRYGLTLVLGGGEVTLLELTSAYGVFGNEGQRLPPTAILEIWNRNGEVLEKFNPRPISAIERNVARLISDVLSDNAARAPAFGESSALFFPGKEVAVKTGTTNDYRDAWVVGYTQKIVIGSWAGNNDNSPMEKKVAGFIVAPLWHEIMSEALKTIPNEPFPAPEPQDTSSLPPVFRGVWEGGESIIIDTTTGAPATLFTPEEYKEERVSKNIHTILYWIDKNNIRAGRPTNPEKDPQYEHWEFGVRKWVSENNILEGGVVSSDGAVRHTMESRPIITITGLSNQRKYSSYGKIDFSVSAQGAYPIKKIEVYFNGHLVESTTQNNQRFFVSVPQFTPGVGRYELRVEGSDIFENRGENAATIIIE